jgi:hypothetical protein
MSNRYNIYLKNTTTGEEHYHQLFGNNEWYNTFTDYLNSIGANTGDEWIERTKVPDLLELVKAIDETVWNDIVSKEPIIKNKNLNWFDETDMYSFYFDFTTSFIYYKKETDSPVVHSPIYQVAQQITNNGYIFASYSLVNWLEKNNAIKDTKIRFTKHSYMVENTFNEQGEPIIIGDLKPEFELYISYS